MKKTILILVGLLFIIGCERKELTLIDTSVNYSITENTANNLIFNLQSLDINNNGFIVSSFTPNTSCCIGGTFTTDNNITASIDDSNLGSNQINVDNDFTVRLENFNDGMNYYTIELDNGSYKKYFSFQFHYENDVIDYLAVIKNNANDNKENYDDAIFRFDIHTDSSIRVLIETESGFGVLTERITNNTNEFMYITSSGATSILKTSREKI